MTFVRKNCQRVTAMALHTQGFESREVVHTWTSYMTGLKHTGQVPVTWRVYTCIPEPTNPFDPNAIGIWDMGLKKRMGYVPRAVCAEIATMFQASTHSLALMCLCRGRVTARSAQCFYNMHVVQKTETSPTPKKDDGVVAPHAGLGIGVGGGDTFHEPEAATSETPHRK